MFFTSSKHYSFMTYMFDLGVYDHNLWSVLNQGDPSFPLGMIHQSQLLYLLLPLYSLNPVAETLLIIQAIIIPLGALFLYKLAKKELGYRLPALVLAAIYLMYPPLHGISQFDFHLEAFLPTFFIAAFYYFRIEKWKGFTLSIILLLMTMSYASYLVLLFGLYLFLLQVKKVGLRLTTLEFKVLTNKAMLAAIMTISLSLAFGAIHYSSSASLTLGNLQSQPLMSGIDLQDRIEYLTKLYGPLAFVPVLGSIQLVALPWLSFSFLTPNLEYIQIYNQYPAFVVPFLFIGTVQVLKRISRHKRLLTTMIVIMMSTTIISFVATDPVFSHPYRPVTPRWPTVTEKDNLLAQIIQTIPPDASVLTQNNIAPHLTNRRDISILHYDSSPAPAYILLDRSHFSFNEPNIKPALAQVLPKLQANNEYGLKIRCGPIDLLEKGYSGESVVLEGCT